jgi:hypothetical protein
MLFTRERQRDVRAVIIHSPFEPHYFGCCANEREEIFPLDGCICSSVGGIFGGTNEREQNQKMLLNTCKIRHKIYLGLHPPSLSLSLAEYFSLCSAYTIKVKQT